MTSTRSGVMQTWKAAVTTEAQVKNGGASRCGSLENSAKSGSLHPRSSDTPPQQSDCQSVASGRLRNRSVPTEFSKCDDGTED